MIQFVSNHPIIQDISNIEKQFYQQLIQNNEQIIDPSEIKHVCDKKTPTLQNNGYFFEQVTTPRANKHVEYVCKSRSENGCDCKLHYYPLFNRWTHVHQHSHAPPRYHQPAMLCPERKRDLFDWIYAHPPSTYESLDEYRDVNYVAELLNSELPGVQRGDPTVEVKAHHVEEARGKIFKMDQLIDFEELSKGNLTLTLEKDETFLRRFELKPSLTMIYSSPSQVAVLNGLVECDQLVVDVTFDNCPSGVAQLFTLLVKKPNLDPYPVMFALSRSKEQEIYQKVWKLVQELAPSLAKRQSSTTPLCIRLEQFEENLYQATKTLFPQANIVASASNWIASINGWISRNRTPSYPILDRDRYIQLKLQKDLHEMCETESIEQFLCTCNKFDEFYSGFDRDFVVYMLKTYLQNNAKFPPNMWARSHQPKSALSCTTSDSISMKKYHKRVNAWFKTRPSLRKSILILQRVEYLSSIGKLYESDSYLIPDQVEETKFSQNTL